MLVLNTSLLVPRELSSVPYPQARGHSTEILDPTIRIRREPCNTFYQLGHKTAKKSKLVARRPWPET